MRRPENAGNSAWVSMSEPTGRAPRADAAAVASGWDRVGRLQADMDEGRQRRLTRLDFSPDEAAALSARNFMYGDSIVGRAAVPEDRAGASTSSNRWTKTIVPSVRPLRPRREVRAQLIGCTLRSLAPQRRQPWL